MSEIENPPKCMTEYTPSSERVVWGASGRIIINGSNSKRPGWIRFYATQEDVRKRYEGSPAVALQLHVAIECVRKDGYAGLQIVDSECVEVEAYPC